MSSLNRKDRVSLCSFTFSDGRRCRTPRFRDNPHFCFYHAQKEARARTAETLGKDLAYFFSGDYLSACDLSTALARLIPAVVRGDVKPRTARTVAYLAQTLLQTIHISEQEYINAFGSDGWRKSIRNSVKGNTDYLYPPAPKPEPHPDQGPHVLAGLKTGEGQPPQPAATPVNSHSDAVAQAEIHPDPLGRPELPAFSASSAASPSNVPQPVPQTAPQPQTSLPPTSAAFAQHLLAGLPRSVRPGSTEETDGDQAPQQPAATPQRTETPSSCHSERREEPAVSESNPSHHSPLPQTPAPNRNAHALHFDHNCRLLVDGKPF
jgi:hypothetical protein